MTFAEFITAERKNSGMDGRSFADHIGCPYSQLKYWTQGGHPTVKSIRRIMKALGTSPEHMGRIVFNLDGDNPLAN